MKNGFLIKTYFNLYNKEIQISTLYIYDGLTRKIAQWIDEQPEIKEKYAKYLKEFNLYD